MVEKRRRRRAFTRGGGFQRRFELGRQLARQRGLRRFAGQTEPASPLALTGIKLENGYLQFNLDGQCRLGDGGVFEEGPDAGEALVVGSRRPVPFGAGLLQEPGDAEPANQCPD